VHKSTTPCRAFDLLLRPSCSGTRFILFLRLHLDNNSILHHQRYLGQPFSSHPHEKANAFATEAKKGGKIGKDPKEGEGGVDGQLCLAS